MRTRDSFLSRLILVTLALAFLLVLWRSLPWMEATMVRGRDPEPRPVLARGDLAADEKNTIELFEKSKGSVVFISTQQQVMDFWTRNMLSVRRGTGSGFIWDDKGHVVTNFHVIAGASDARVRLSDGRDYHAALVGASRAHDLAVLSIGVGFKSPPPVPLGASNNLKVGQKVYAIGNPFGLDWTLTMGIISALDRSLTGDDDTSIDHLIQTDAAINPGNSGGPLLDSAGRLIGITTAIYSPSGASAGIGFAVPVDTVNRVVPQLIAKGKYIRPALGIEVDEKLNQLAQRRLGIEGVLILKVLPGTAAAAAGLRGSKLTPDGGIITGDIITAVEGKPVESVGKLFTRLDDYQIGTSIRLTVLREGKSIDLKVTLQPGT